MSVKSLWREELLIKKTLMRFDLYPIWVGGRAKEDRMIGEIAMLIHKARVSGALKRKQRDIQILKEFSTGSYLTCRLDLVQDAIRKDPRNCKRRNK